MKILLSGSTGFIGQYLKTQLETKAEVTTLSRGTQGDLQADLTQWDGNLPLADMVSKKYDVFVHAAGLYDLRASAAELHLQNVTALHTALTICEKLGIQHFINLSSIAAGINSPLSRCKPEDLYLSRAFPDAYSESKAHGEKLLMNFATGPKIRTNLRLGAVVGSTNGEKIERIDGPYHAPMAFRKAKFVIEKIPTQLYLPGSEDTALPIIPVDTAAKAISDMVDYSLQKQVDQFESFNLTPQKGLLLKQLYSDSLKYQAIKNNGVKIVEYIPDSVAMQMTKWSVNLPNEELRYILNIPVYDSSRTQAILGEEWCPEYQTYQKAFWSGYEKYLSYSRN